MMLINFFAHFHTMFRLGAMTALLLMVGTRPCSASTTLLVCGSHGTYCLNCDEPERQCMKVRPLNDRVLAAFPVPTCPQIDLPSLNLDAGRPQPAETIPDATATEEKEIFSGSRGHRQLPRTSKPKEIVVVGSKLQFVVEMDVNNETAVWWHHIQEQDDGCDSNRERQGRPESLRLDQVDFLVFEDTAGINSCNDYWDAVEMERSSAYTASIPEIGDEVLAVGQQVHVLLQEVLIEGVNLNLATEGARLTQTVSLTMNNISLYVQDGNELAQLWHRSIK